METMKPVALLYEVHRQLTMNLQSDVVRHQLDSAGVKVDIKSSFIPAAAVVTL